MLLNRQHSILVIQLRCIRQIHNTTRSINIYSSALFRMFFCSILSLSSKNHAYLLNRFSTEKTRTMHVLRSSEKQFKSSLAINKSIRWVLIFQYYVCSRTHMSFAPSSFSAGVLVLLGAVYLFEHVTVPFVSGSFLSISRIFKIRLSLIQSTYLLLFISMLFMASSSPSNIFCSYAFKRFVLVCQEETKNCELAIVRGYFWVAIVRSIEILCLNIHLCYINCH